MTSAWGSWLWLRASYNATSTNRSRSVRLPNHSPTRCAARRVRDFLGLSTAHVGACLQGDGVYQVRLKEEDSELHMRVAMVSRLFNESDCAMVALSLDQTALSLTKIHK